MVGIASDALDTKKPAAAGFLGRREGVVG
jgi:hypothetical protein